MELINRIRKSRKGFTLVEIIVVLVILAVLAAFTIPTMIGFVDDAKGKALIAEAREVYVAAQATATEYKGTGRVIPVNELNSNYVQWCVANPTNTTTYLPAKQMKTYLGTDLIVSNVDATSATQPVAGQSKWAITLDANYKVTRVVYTKNGYAITIDETTGSPKTTVIKL